MPFARQGRIEASSARRRNTDGAVGSIADSPYAAGGGTIGGSNGTSATGGGNATWKHKHTKTLPWGDEGEALGGAGVVGGEDDGGRDLFGFGRPTATQLARKGAEEGRGGAPRSGYRTQVRRLAGRARGGVLLRAEVPPWFDPPLTFVVAREGGTLPCDCCLFSRSTNHCWLSLCSVPLGQRKTVDTFLARYMCSNEKYRHSVNVGSCSIPTIRT